MLNSNFSTKFSFLLNILRFPSIINIHIIKIITWIELLQMYGTLFFSPDPTDILLCRDWYWL